MSDLEPRLTNCFAVVFPELTLKEIPSVSMGALAGWDSVAGITLLSVMEEEFNLTISPDDVPDLVSYELMLAYLTKRSSEAAK